MFWWNTVYLVEQYIKYVKKLLAHIYNTYFKSGISPDMLTMAEVKPLHKRCDTYTESQTIITCIWFLKNFKMPLGRTYQLKQQCRISLKIYTECH